MQIYHNKKKVNLLYKTKQLNKAAKSLAYRVQRPWSALLSSPGSVFLCNVKKVLDDKVAE